MEFCSLIETTYSYLIKRTLVHLKATLQKLGRTFVSHLFPDCLVYPVKFEFGLYWEQPCKPSLVAYWIIEECYLQDNSGCISLSGFIVKFVICLVNAWMWVHNSNLNVIAGRQC